MNFLNIFNSVESNLEKSLKDFNHSDSNNFINELQKYLNYHTIDIKNEPIFYSLDRYEGNYAICENRATGDLKNVLKSEIPVQAKDGDILKFENGIYKIDILETQKQKQISRDLFNKMHSNK